ncbi:HAD-IA family hydrolase [Methyloparacoccus murrellii]
MRPAYDLIVFDWDGTLFDSVGWIVDCIQRAALASDRAVPSEQAARSVIGLSLQQAMAALYPGSNEVEMQRFVAHYRTLYHAPPGASLQVFAGVSELLTALRAQGYKLGLATGKARSGLEHALQATGMGGYFDATRCADETASKPHPRMLHELLEQLSVPRRRALLVGDSLHDLRMARNAGVDAVAVSCGANTPEELAELAPLACLEGPSALYSFLNG